MYHTQSPPLLKPLPIACDKATLKRTESTETHLDY